MTTTTPAVTPLHRHDCGPEHGCRYLGIAPGHDYAPDGVEFVDLWVHTGPGGDRSFLYRWASDEPEYCSAPEDVFTNGMNPHLDQHPLYAEARRRADLPA